MRIINETGWRTDQVRTIVRRVAAEEVDSDHRKRAIIQIKYRGRNRCLGRGTLGRSPQEPAHTIWVFVPRIENIRREGKGWCGKEGCGLSYHRHQVGHLDHRFVPIPVEPRLSGPQIAHVVAHEFQHNLGRHHRQMHRKYLVHDYSPWSWAADIEPALPPKKRSPIETVEGKLVHASGMLRKAETRAKRAATILKKWQRRVRALAHRAAAFRNTSLSSPHQQSATLQRRCQLR